MKKLLRRLGLIRGEEMPPPNIIEAAGEVSLWFEKRGIKSWTLGGVCSRSFADTVEDIKKFLDNGG